MNSIKSILTFAAVLCAVTSSAFAQGKTTSSVTVTYRDHHQQTFSSSEVSRIDLRDGKLVVILAGKEEQIPLNTVANIEVHEASADSALSRSHFIGRWEVGMGGGQSGSFIVTLDRDGHARKNVGGRRGTWTFVNGAARINWDDGWTDIIVQTGNTYEKRAYESGKPLTGPPTNVTYAKRANEQSI
jgi:hypothetical protein